MDLDIILEKAGRTNKYQFIVLTLFFLFWGGSEYLSIILPFLQLKPKVEFTDKNNQTHISRLNYTICQTYQYKIITELDLSLITELAIECDKQLTILISFCLYFGGVVGSTITFMFADKYGRKVTLLICSLVFGIIQIPVYWIKNIVIIYIWLFLSGIFYSIITITILVTTIEIVQKKYLAILICIIFNSFSLFGVCFTLYFRYINDWRFIIFIIVTLFMLLMPISYIYLEESPAFLYTKGQFNQFFRTICRIATKNNKTLIESDFMIENNIIEKKSKKKKDLLGISLSGITLSTSLIQADNDDTEENSSKISLLYSEMLKSNTVQNLKKNFNKFYTKKTITEFSLIDLIKNERQAIKFLILTFLWISNAIIATGLTINIKNLYGDLYSNFIFVFLIEIIFSIFIGLLTNIKFFGRKRTLILLQLISFISYMTCLLYEDHPENISYNYCLFTSRICIISSKCILCYYSSEIYPIVLRAKGIGVNYGMYRLGSSISPFIIEQLSNQSIVSVFAILNIISTLLTFALPETIKKPIQNFLEEIEDSN